MVAMAKEAIVLSNFQGLVSVSESHRSYVKVQEDETRERTIYLHVRSIIYQNVRSSH